MNFYSEINSAVKRLLPLLILMMIIKMSLTSLDVVGLDWVNRQVTKYRSPDPEIILVTIDDESLSNLHDEWGKWPWDRSLHAFLLEEIEQAGAKVIGYDILFSQPDRYRADGDDFFNEVISQYKNIVFAASKLGQSSSESGVLVADLVELLHLKATEITSPTSRVSMDLPWAIRSEFWRLGAVNFLMGDDGIGREYPQHLNLSGWLFPTLAMEMNSLVNGSTTNSEIFDLNWQSLEQNPYVSYSYSDIYQWIEEGDAASLKNAFENKWVMIGATASGLFDALPTVIAPFQPGIILHATALDNLKNNMGYQKSNGNITLAALMLVFAIGTRIFSKLSFIKQVVFSLCLWLAASSLLIIFSVWIAKTEFILIPWLSNTLSLASALLINILVASWMVYRQNLRTLDTFSRFMEPKIVSLLSKQKKLEPNALTRRCDITVLFTDIRGFTTLSESKTAEQVIELLNSYFAGQVKEIFNHQGTFDKYIGDAVMAFWGAPVEDPDHADNAVKCALAMLVALDEFKLSLGTTGENFDIGIGIHSGPAIVGMLGSSQRYDYTAIGDTVNVASRIEGQTKNRARLLISSNTKALLNTNYNYISHGNVQLRGRTSEIELFEVVEKQEILNS